MSCSVLIVDDGYEKTQVISKIAKDDLFCNVDYCNSIRQALQFMSLKHYHILIVDIQIPTSLGEPINEKGGIELVEIIELDNNIYKPVYIIGVTSHHHSYDKWARFFLDKGWPLILGIEDIERIKTIIANKVAHYKAPETVKCFDVAIVTALTAVELDAVLKLECGWEEFCLDNDESYYYSGEIIKKNGDVVNVLATSCSRMGIASASATVMKVCNYFNPKKVFMCGIAAGIKGKVNLGDIMVGDPCWDWESGKNTITPNGRTEMRNAPHQVAINVGDRTKFQRISTRRLFLDAIFSGWPSDKRPTTPLSLKVGPIATGAVVLENPIVVEDIQSQHRETIGIEMEGYGAMLAATLANKGGVDCIIVKSVCDFADPEKNDDWQDYAAYTSATIVYHYIVDFL
ncbi:phosphorylase family protein [Halomonas sp. AOP31-E2-25]